MPWARHSRAVEAAKGLREHKRCGSTKMEEVEPWASREDVAMPVLPHGWRKPRYGAKRHYLGPLPRALQPAGYTAE